MKNTWTKTRKATESPYYTVTQDGWTWNVRKVWSDPRKPYARAFCQVITPMTSCGGDLGDTYAADVPGLIHAWELAHQEKVNV